jgi:hypothetical protein
MAGATYHLYDSHFGGICSPELASLIFDRQNQRLNLIS